MEDRADMCCLQPGCTNCDHLYDMTVLHCAALDHSSHRSDPVLQTVKVLVEECGADKVGEGERARAWREEEDDGVHPTDRSRLLPLLLLTPHHTTTPRVFFFPPCNHINQQEAKTRAGQTAAALAMRGEVKEYLQRERREKAVSEWVGACVGGCDDACGGRRGVLIEL